MMKRLPQLLALCLLALPALHGQPNWNNLGMYRLNKVQPHDRIVPEGKWSMSLNGTWSFAYFDAPGAIRTPVGQLPLRDTIHVPGNMELQGYGVPVYVNMRNEFPPNPPYAPTAYNPVGVYGRTFTLPEHWKGRRVIVKFGAAKSALYLYVNGTEVGYSQDSKTPAEWDITKYLHEGKNDLRAKVLRWCDGSYLECQDMWRMSGLTRDVELYSVPWTYITDIKIVSDLDTNDWRTGRLDVMVDLNREVGGGSIEWRLERGDWSVRGRQQLERNDWFTSFARNVGTVEPWSDSTPALYTLTLRLLAANGNEIERIVKRWASAMWTYGADCCASTGAPWRFAV